MVRSSQRKEANPKHMAKVLPRMGVKLNVRLPSAISCRL